MFKSRACSFSSAAGAVLFVLVVSSATLLRASPPVSPDCEPAPAIRAAIDDLESERFDRLPSGKRRIAQVERLRELLRDHPNDLFLHRTLQRRLLGTKGGRGTLVAEYRSLAQEHPKDPRFLYLYGRALQMTQDESARQPFEHALELDSAFPWSHLGLATLQLGETGNAKTMQKHLRRFWKNCPDTLEPYRFAGGHDPRFNREVVARLRPILERRTDSEAIHTYSDLWAREFKIHPSTEHGKVRAQVAKDVQRIRSLSRTGDKEWYLTLREGYSLAGDRAGEQWAEGQFLDRFGYTDDAQDMVMERWWAENPYPGDPKSAEGRKRMRELHRETGRWVKQWPDSIMAWFYRLEAAAKLEDLSQREALGAADGFLEARRNDPDGMSAVPPFEFSVARLYLDRGVRLDRVPALVQRPIGELEASLKKDYPKDLQEYGRKNLEFARWHGWPLLVELHLKQGDRRRARAVLSELENLLAPTPVSPPPAPSQRAAGRKGAKQKAAESTNQGEEDQRLTEAWHRATLLYWKGRLAEADKHPADAWTYYRAGLLALSGKPGGSLKETRDQIEADARRVWKKLGGTEEGWRAALDPSPEERTHEVAEMAGGWRDKGASLPEFELLDLSGKRWTHADLRGKVSFINVWATWCGPCQAELPNLQKLYERLRGRSGIQVLTLNVDGNPGVVAPFLAKREWTFPTLIAGDYPDKVMGRVGIPQNWIVDREGRLIREQIGFGGEGKDWIEQALLEIEKAAGTR